MLIDVVHRNCPTVGGVTQVALRAILPPMNVGVTVLALLTCIRKHRINVALLASYFRMHAAKRKRSFGVIELRLRP
jgi:hypothetical protein